MDKPWIAESNWPFGDGRWYQLENTDVEVQWIERAGHVWLRHRLVSKNRPTPLAHLDQVEVQREIKSEGGRTWRRTVRIVAEDWVADEEEK